MRKLKEYGFVYSFGAVLYSAIEISFRGFTHWTMALTGGLAYLLIYITNLKMKTKNLFLRCLSGCAIITGLEFIVGCVVNRRFHLCVWDYSDRPGQILGQICPLFSFLWFLLSFPAMLLTFYIKAKLFSPCPKKKGIRQLFLK